MMRVGARLRRDDPALLDEWYLRAGTALHVDGRKPHRPEVARALLEDMGLDPGLVDEAIADETTTDEVRAEHEAAVAGGGWGVPILHFSDDDTGRFGPVVVDPPTGEAAVRLWDLVCGWREFPHLYEVQRPKRPADIALIAERVRPYLEARDWITIQKETP